MKPEQKIIQARKNKGLSQTEVAALLGNELKNEAYSLRQYQRLEKGEFPKYKSEVVKALEKVLSIKIYDTIYDNNAITENVTSDTTSSYIEKRRKLKNSSKPFLAPFVPIKAQAGYVRAIDQEMFLDTLEQYALPPGVNPQGAVWRWWQVEGDSMEPAFHNNDIILTSQVPFEDWNSNVRNFYVYVIVTEERILIKRVYCKNQLEWVLISENETKYDQQLLPADSVKELWVFRRKMQDAAPPSKMFKIKV